MLKNLLNNTYRHAKLISEQASSLHTHRVAELRLTNYGPVDKALELSTHDLTDSSIHLKNHEIFVKLIAAPINPADLNIIQGRYGALPDHLPAVIGNEGLFEVVKVSGATSRFKPGDWALPLGLGWGTWRSHAIADETIFHKVPNNLEKHACATLKINPCTAHRMLVNFRQLKPNDTVIQNGANSGVGQAVIQLGRIMKLNVVNIVRKRADQEGLDRHLRSLGATYVFTEDELRSSKYLTSELWKEIPRPRLAFNCVGGKATTDMVRLLDTDAVVVTYGGMSKQPLAFNTADFIFKDLKAVGFWLTSWRAKNGRDFEQTLDYLCSLVASGQFKAPQCEEFALERYREAFDRFQTPQISSKILLVN